MHQPAILALEDGSIFTGTAVGHLGEAVGEVVFNTSMTGYQEILSDPSYAEQMVTLTVSHVGNVGTNAADNESAQVYAKGLIIRDLPALSSNWREEKTLPDYLKENQVVAISQIDTRELTNRLREKGAMRGCIMAGKIDETRALTLAKDCPSLKGQDLAKEVTCKKSYEWKDSTWVAPGEEPEAIKPEFHVVALDFGVKHNILRLLVAHGCKVTVVPAKTTFEQIMKLKPDGVFLSNGPGDPEPCDYAIETIQALLETGLPLFGICLGHQLLALALGAKTYKMKFGHHGGNHPVQDLKTQSVMITAQNHGFAVSEDDLPEDVMVTHRSLFDGTIQGIRAKNAPAFSFQGHPEASPGPHDVIYLFKQFTDDMKTYLTNQKSV